MDILLAVKEVERVFFGEYFVGNLQGIGGFHDALDGKAGNDYQGLGAVSKLGVLHFESVGTDGMYKIFAHSVKIDRKTPPPWKGRGNFLALRQAQGPYKFTELVEVNVKRGSS